MGFNIPGDFCPREGENEDLNMPGDLTGGKEKGIVLTCPGMQTGDGYLTLDTIEVLPRRVEMTSNAQHNRDFSPQSRDFCALDTIGFLARRVEMMPSTQSGS